jgi:hypothetical protein
VADQKAIAEALKEEKEIEPVAGDTDAMADFIDGFL